MSKELFCGECDKFLYEEVFGYSNCYVMKGCVGYTMLKG